MKSKGFAKGAPDLAVEIFSPSDSVPQLILETADGSFVQAEK